MTADAKDFSEVPKADSCGAANQQHVLFDHLVGAGEKGGRYREAECRRCLQIDNQFVFVRLLDWQITGLLAFQNAIGIGGCARILFKRINSIGNKAAAMCKKPVRIQSR